MLPESYCTPVDVQSIIGIPGVRAMSDDSHTGGLSVAEENYINACIERTAAIEINAVIADRYNLQAMKDQGNQWLRWANAMFAAFDIMTRRGQQVSQSIVHRCTEMRRQMRAAVNYRNAIPGGIENFDVLPSATNFEVERWRKYQPVRVVPQSSTRTNPGDGIQRHVANEW